MSVTYGSTFSGIGGLDVAVERVFGATPLWHVEPNPYAAAVLRKHWPDVPNLERIENVGPETPRPTIICGGFPCQDISSAGAKAGIHGARSGLWWELARAIGDLGPDIVILENVSALTHRGLGDVLGELARLRFDAAWAVVRASDVGAPHERARCFIVAVGHAYRARWAEQWFSAVGQAGGGLASDSGGTHAMADAHRGGRVGLRGGGIWEGDQHRESTVGGGDVDRCDGHVSWPPAPRDQEGWERWPGARPGVRRGSYGPPNGMDSRRRRARLERLGNAVVPAQAEWAIRGLWARLMAV